MSNSFTYLNIMGICKQMTILIFHYVVSRLVAILNIHLFLYTGL
jgi:hypothetical protein